MEQSFRFPITALLAFYPIARRKNTKIWSCTGFIFNHFAPIPLPMPRNRVSNNLDQVPADQEATKVSKASPQEPRNLPKYAPLRIASTYPCSNLPPHIMDDDPYEIFTLFFDDEILTILANNTNEYA